MAGIAKEIYIDQLMEPFYAEASFFDFAQDMTMYVENNTINLAEAGVDPEVLVNNTTYPVATVERVDNPIAIPLDTHDTVNTVVRNVVALEASYDLMESVLRGHRRSLRVQALRRAAHAYSAQANSAFTPVLACSGPIRADTGRKRMTLADLAAMKTKMTLLEGGGPFVAVLHPYHLADLKAEDSNFNRNFVDYAGGTIASRLENFLIIEYPGTAVYTNAGVKKAYGAVAVPATDCYSSFCFMQDEVMKADGPAEMFVTLKDPTQRGDIVGFQRRFKALPIRNKFIGAWYSGT
jgi:hypothetical protein